MEDKKTLCKGSDCGCNHKSLLCWVVGLVILMIIFCAGYKLGQWSIYFHSYKQDYYGYQTSGMMRRENPGYGMMRGLRNYQITAPDEQPNLLPATTTTNTTIQE
jgi:hypothetical protein